MVEQSATLPQVLKHWAETEPDKEVFIFVDKQSRLSQWTPRSLYVTAGRFAARLRSWGFVKGDVIANSLVNCPERLVTDLGIMMAGCVVLNVQVLEKDGADLYHIARQADCKAIVFPDIPGNSAHRLLAPQCRGPHTAHSQPHDLALPQCPSLQKAILIGRGTSGKQSEVGNDVREGSFLESLLLQNEEEAVFVEHGDCEDCVYIFTTSGTTGYSKLVPRTHAEVLRASRAYEPTKDLLSYIDRPLGWAGGFPYDFFGFCTPRVVQDAFFGQQAVLSADVWAVLERESCDAAVLLPLTLLEIVDHFKGGNPPRRRLKCIITAGQPMKKGVAAAAGLLTDAILIAYASTETLTASVAYITHPSQYHDYMAGRPVSGVEVRVVDEQMRELEAGTEGFLLIRSPQTCKSYYKLSPPSPAFTPDGWYVSKDRGKLDKDGVLWVYCRSGDVTSRGSILVYHSWPEKIISKCPDVADVTMVNLKTEHGDERLVACVMPVKGSSLTESALNEFYQNCFMNADLGGEFYPTVDHVMFCDVFPVTANGKVDKRQLAQDALGRFPIPSSTN